MKKVLITGASGFIGRNCLSRLTALGYDVCAITPDPIEDADSGIRWYRTNLLDPLQTEKLVAEIKATHLLHFAWYAEPQKYWSSEENYKWVEASKVLLNGFYANGGRRAVMAGTCAEYDWKHGCCIENSTPLIPATLYGKCKNSFRKELSDFSEETGLSSAWGRIFFLYGPHEYPQRLVSSVIISVLQGKPASCSHGEQIRDFLHVEDVASAFIALLESEVCGPVNIASGQPLALKEVICKIGEKLKRPDLIHLGDIPTSKDDPPLLVADVGKLREKVGWTPVYDIESGLDQTIHWWEQNLWKVKGR